jgi:hypothetical protein
MPNRAIEFHDSTFDGVRQQGNDLTLRFSAAYIHESNGEPGVDAGSGWVQEALLHVEGGSIASEIRELPCDLWNGNLRLGGQLFEMIPIPLDYDGQVEISLEQDGSMRITGTRVRLELIGTPSYVEQFRGHR